MEHLQLDQRGDGLYSGTFRWSESKNFLKLPLFPSNIPDVTQGWQEYLSSRTETEILVDNAKKDPSFLDALSFPMSLIHAITILKFNINTEDNLTIIVIGATVKAEERILKITNYWNELSNFINAKRIILCLTGPEISQSKLFSSTKKMEIHLFKGKAKEFLSNHKLNSNNTIVIGYNTGFGNFIETNQYDLLLSWLPDLDILSKTNIPIIFTCANDYADIQGEFKIQTNIIGAKFLLLPKQNSFCAASHLHEGKEKYKSWSRANSFYYVIQGYEKERKFTSDFISIQEIKTRIEKMENKNLILQDRLHRSYINGTILSAEESRKSRDIRTWLNRKMKEEQNNEKKQEKKKQEQQNKKREEQQKVKREQSPEMQVSKRKESISLLVQLPGVQDISELILLVSYFSFSLDVPGRYHTRMEFQQGIKENNYKATFDKKMQQLKLILPIYEEREQI